MRIVNWIYTLPMKLHSLLRQSQLDQELDDELRCHLECKTEENVAKGMSEQEARRAALMAMDGVERTKEECRDARRINFLQTLLQDFRFGLRMLCKNPGFSAVAVLTLALGIGATTATYSVTYATLIEPLPYPKPDRLVMVWPQLKNKRVWGASVGDFLDWKQQNTVFSDLNATMGDGPRFNLATNSRPEYVVAQSATPGYYDMIGIPFMLGRNFVPEEGTPGKEHVVLLTYRLWKKLGADRNIVGHLPADERRALHSGGSRRARPVGPHQFRSRCAACVQAGANQSRISLAVCHGTTETRRLPCRRQFGDERDRSPHRPGSPGHKQRVGGQRRAFAK